MCGPVCGISYTLTQFQSPNEIPRAQDQRERKHFQNALIKSNAAVINVCDDNGLKNSLALFSLITFKSLKFGAVIHVTFDQQHVTFNQHVTLSSP